MSPRALSLALSAGLALSLGACGSDDTPEGPGLSPAKGRAYYGLNPGSCWRYKTRQNNITLYLATSVSGPNTMSVANRTVYELSRQPDSGGLPEVWFLDAETGGEVRLVRSMEGRSSSARITYRYGEEVDGAAQSEPVFAKYQAAGEDVSLRLGDRFEVTTSPVVSCPPENTSCPAQAAQRHTWTVVGEAEMVATGRDTREAVRLQYRRDDSDANYWLVPGFGFAKFRDFDNTEWQLCQFRVCDAAGVCEGADDCNQPCAP